jgi:hypothetical protein
MRTPRSLSPALVLLLVAASPSLADELLPPAKPIEEVVDHYVEARLRQESVTPAPQAEDVNLVRRLTLDLAGRIPTAAEARAYAASTDPAKRVQLVDRLLASPAFVRHQADEFDMMLMSGNNSGRSLRDYLTRALKENRPWDRIFRDLVLPDERDPAQKGAGEFLRSRIMDLDRLTAEVSVVFFGVNVSCAQCHDHPKVDDWKQDHFYGMKAFFSRTFDNGGFLAEREYGEVRFKTTKGQEKLAKMMFLSGRAVDDPAGTRKPSGEEQRKERDLLESAKRKRQPPPAPKFSARAKLVETALQPGQSDFFARAIVNRLWHRVFGYGLVMPLDQMHSANDPSHPELLQWLARDLVAHRYDLRRLVRGLVLSKAYSRGSRVPLTLPSPPSAGGEGRVRGTGPAPRPDLFAVARVRALTPMQLATSLRLATADPASLPVSLKPEEFEKRIEQMENSARGFARDFEQPGDDFQVSVTEALLFSNGERMQREMLADGGDRLIGRLKQIQDTKELVDVAMRNVLSRAATEEEQQLLGDYLKRRVDRRVEACRQIVWALLTSSEFRFNY